MKSNGRDKGKKQTLNKKGKEKKRNPKLFVVCERNAKGPVQGLSDRKWPLPAETYLSMSVDDRSEQLPRSSSTIHANHSQYLKEAQSTQSRSSEDLTATLHNDDGDAGNDDDHIWSRVTNGDRLEIGSMSHAPEVKPNEPIMQKGAFRKRIRPSHPW
jgi:hypothetical protein